MSLCNQCLSATQDGNTVYYVCRNPDSKHFNKRISVRAHDTCQGTSSKTPPNIVRRAVSYAEAVIEWTAAGRPERSKEDVQRIFETHCKSCKRFDPDRQLCLDCGCRVARSGFAIFNKIKMATQQCPRRKW